MRYSAVIPVYNNSYNQIKRALESVVNQTYKASKIILVDDGSTVEDTLIALNNFAKEKDVILVHKENEGAGSARNRGASLCTSEIIAFLDCDDFWKCNKMAIQMNYIINNPEIKAIGCLYEPIPKWGKLNDPVRILNLKDQIIRNHIQTSTLAIYRDSFSLVGGFPTNQTHAEEGDLYFKILQYSGIAIINSALVIYGQGEKGFNPEGLSANHWKMYKGEYWNFTRLYHRKQITKRELYLLRLFNLVKFLIRLLKRSIK